MPLPDLESGRLFTLHPDAAFQVIDDETIIVVPREKMMHSLKKTGTVLWQALEAGADLDRLVGVLVDSFEVEEGRAREDVIVFLEDLWEKGLIREAEGA